MNKTKIMIDFEKWIKLNRLENYIILINLGGNKK
jgi:hypothetical protein